jgi:RNA polymerase sigma-70 factor (sigma-E family)
LEYDEFVATRLPGLLRYAVMLTGDTHLAQDLVQETMVRVQLKWRRVASTDVPELYVRGMLTNAYLDARRGSWLRRVIPFADAAEEAPRPTTVADPAVAHADRDEVWALLAQLPHRQRAALVLRFYEGLPDADIAAVLHCAIGTVRSLISRALTTLRAQLETPSSIGEPR